MSNLSVISKHRFVAPAQVRKPNTLTQATRDLLSARLLDPSILDDDSAEPFVWEAVVSNNTRDFYHTRMAKGTLENFARDAAKGVSFLDSHAWRQLGLGYTFDGRVQESDVPLEEFPNEKRLEVIVSAYTIPGYSPGGGIGTDDFIRGVRASLIRDVSVGFYATVYPCSICGLNMFDWGSGCYHIPGFVYEKMDPDGNVIGEEVCFAWVADGRLSEVSAVYDGANEDAGISSIIPFAKAQLEAEAGRLKPRQRDLLEARYRHRLPTVAKSFAASVAQGGNVGMNKSTFRSTELDELEIPEPDDTESTEDVGDETPTDTPDTELDETVEVPDDGADKPTGEAADAGETTTDAAAERAKAIVASLRAKLSAKGLGLPKGKLTIEAAVDHLIGEVQRLRSLADDGEAYRNDLIADTLREGKRALGKNFREETYRAILNGQTIDQIKEVRDSFKQDGDSTFTGGRHTRNRASDKAERDDTPTAAYS